jgi:ABC-2 type transport system permease protein
MSLHRTLATTGRVLRQLRHDHRTLGLILFVPCILLILLKYVFDGESRQFDQFAPLMLGIFPFTVMFVVASVATLRERTTHTLERLMTLPLSRLDVIFGYALAFTMLALLQALLASFVALQFLDLTVAAGTLPVLITASLAGLLGMAMGLFLSAFARTEFQAVQFLPAFVLPQLLICGLFVARDNMADPLRWLSDVMPLTYSVDAMKQITQHSDWTGGLTWDLIIVGSFALGALILGAATLRRQN